MFAGLVLTAHVSRMVMLHRHYLTVLIRLMGRSPPNGTSAAHAVGLLGLHYACSTSHDSLAHPL